MVRYFVYLSVISIVYKPVTRSDPSIKELSENAFQVIKGENLLKDFNDGKFLSQVCNDTYPCQNGGTCYKDWCRCFNDYTGDWCETPKWCTNGRCGYGNDVECTWNHYQQEGSCRCKKENYFYLSKDRQCHACECGDHGKCQVVDDMLVCKCDKMYALKSSKCEYCDCGPRSEKCSYSSRGDKICQCQERYASKTANWSSYGTWCEICDCGDHGRCRWLDNDKICDCEDNFRSFDGKCKECNCGEYGTCELSGYGEKVCSCDYGYAEKYGVCSNCDCNPVVGRYIGVDCIFKDGRKQCICPPGFDARLGFCQDIDECYLSSPCPANTICINKPGTFECRCKKGFEPIGPLIDQKLSGCADINECYDSPCQSRTTQCVNSPGSYDCVCKDGYYSTSGNYGNSYKPAYNTCHEIETQWREATIAIGVIFSVIIIGMTCYILKHKA